MSWLPKRHPKPNGVSMSELLYEKQDRVAVLTFNRPDRMNTINPSMLRSLSEHLVEANKDRDVRAIVLTGAGRAFCAGLDIADASAGKNIGGDTSKMSATIDLRDAPPIVLHNIDKPTLCALNGGAAGYDGRTHSRVPVSRKETGANRFCRRRGAG